MYLLSYPSFVCINHKDAFHSNNKWCAQRIIEFTDEKLTWHLKVKPKVQIEDGFINITFRRICFLYFECLTIIVCEEIWQGQLTQTYRSTMAWKMIYRWYSHKAEPDDNKFNEIWLRQLQPRIQNFSQEEACDRGSGVGRWGRGGRWSDKGG